MIIEKMKNDDRNDTYDKFTYFKFKTTMQNESLCDYSDADILAVGRRTAAGQGAYAAAIAEDRIKKELVFKNYAPFLKSTSKINDKDNTEDVDIVCKCIIYQDTVKMMQKHQLVYGDFVEINQMTK